MTEEIKPTSPSTLPLSTDTQPNKENKQHKKPEQKKQDKEPPPKRPKKGLFDEFV